MLRSAIAQYIYVSHKPAADENTPTTRATKTSTPGVKVDSRCIKFSEIFIICRRKKGTAI